MVKKRRIRTLRGWKKATRVLETWRRHLTPVTVELKQPRPVGMILMDLSTGELLDPKPSESRKKFKAALVFHTPADVTLRFRSGALLVIDSYEIQSLTAGGTKLIP